ncbi:MAG: metallophosphoesterase family protein [Clostridiales bacterium]|nr:metallophosphoesterase family protein [Clostridiales bacterium]
MVYFTSDLHLGHKNCIDFCARPFASVDDMDEALISGWNNRVKNDDTVYIVGDLVWESSDPLKYLSRLNGKKILIVGNHDIKWLKRYGMAAVADDGHVEFRDYSEYFINIAQYVEISLDGVAITLCHYPMLEWKASRKVGSKKVGYLIHGHSHNSRDKKYTPLWLLPHALNAGTDVNNYAPATFDELVKNNEAFKLSALNSPVDKAQFLASKYHLYQSDKSGKPYVLHPMTVAEKQTSDDAKCVALLHDTLEDTDIDIRLLEQNFSQEVVTAVKLLTHAEGVDYFDYVRGLKDNPLAVAVKLADLEHNSDLSRLKAVTEHDLQRLEKYKKAREILLNCV